MGSAYSVPATMDVDRTRSVAWERQDAWGLVGDPVVPGHTARIDGVAGAVGLEIPIRGTDQRRSKTPPPGHNYLLLRPNTYFGTTYYYSYSQPLA